MFKTESEAWEAIADTLEMIRDLPDSLMPIIVNEQRTGAYYKVPGLCGVLAVLKSDGLISESLRHKMLNRIYLLRARRDGRLFLYKPGKWKPRAKLARRFAAESQSEERRRV